MANLCWMGCGKEVPGEVQRVCEHCAEVWIKAEAEKEAAQWLLREKHRRRLYDRDRAGRRKEILRRARNVRKALAMLDLQRSPEGEPKEPDVQEQ